MIMLRAARTYFAAVLSVRKMHTVKASSMNVFGSLHEIVRCPTCFCDASRDLIAGLLAKKPEDRLTGAAVRGHAFFAGTDWDAMLRRELPPPIARADFPVIEGLDGLDVM